MKRATPTSSQTVDPGCNFYRPHYSTVAAYLDYKNANLNTDAIGNYISTTLSSDLARNTPGRSQADMQRDIQINLDSLQNLELVAYNMTRCVQAEILARSERAGEIYRLQDKLSADEKTAKQMELTAQEAKERAKRLDSPYSQTTRHETWLPLGRPLKPESVPVLLSISIVFLILSLGMFLRLASTEFRLQSTFFQTVREALPLRQSSY